MIIFIQSLENLGGYITMVYKVLLKVTFSPCWLDEAWVISNLYSFFRAVQGGSVFITEAVVSLWRNLSQKRFRFQRSDFLKLNFSGSYFLKIENRQKFSQCLLVPIAVKNENAVPPFRPAFSPVSLRLAFHFFVCFARLICSLVRLSWGTVFSLQVSVKSKLRFWTRLHLYSDLGMYTFLFNRDTKCFFLL